jgi:WD40 repeat protein
MGDQSLIKNSTAPVSRSGLLNVFVSYSRLDLAFARWLVDALEVRGLAVRIDMRDLPALEDWRRELQTLLQGADAVVFIVSQRSVASPVCAWEIGEVARFNKRLAPIVLERVPDDRIPESVTKINYLFFDEPEAIEARADDLAKALQTDLVWLKEHTRLGNMAHRWDDRRQPASLLLRQQELSEAELWLASHPRGAPEPTDLHRNFIRASRRSAVRRQRFIAIGSMIIASVGFGLAAVAQWQRGIAQDNAIRAGRSEIATLSELSRAEMARGNGTRALEIALQSYQNAHASDVATDLPEGALYNVIWQRREVRRQAFPDKPLGAWFERKTGQIVLDTGSQQIIIDRDFHETARRATTDGIRPPDGSGLSWRHLNRAAAEPPAVSLSFDPARNSVSFRRPDWRIPLTVDANRLPPTPKSAWLVPVDTTYGGDLVGRLVVQGGEWGSLEFGLIDVHANGSISVRRLAAPDIANFRIDPWGRTIVFGGASFSPVKYFNLGQSGEVGQIHEYIPNIDFNDDIAFNPAKWYIAFIGGSSKVDWEQPRLFDVRSGITVAFLGGHESQPVAVDFSRDGKLLLTLTKNGVVHLWQTEVDADRALVAQHHGYVLQGNVTKATSDATFTSIYEGPARTAREALSAADPSLGTELSGRPGGPYIVHPSCYSSSASKEIRVWQDAGLQTLMFRAKLNACLTGLLYQNQRHSIIASDRAGTIYEWSANGTQRIMRQGAGTAVAAIRFPSADQDQVEFVASDGLNVVNLTTGAISSLLRFALPELESEVTFDDDFISFCQKSEHHDCTLYSRSNAAHPLVAPCDRPLQAHAALGIAYCPARTDGIPTIFDLRDNGHALDVATDRLALPVSLQIPATISVEAVPGCRRGFVTVGGGIADAPFPDRGMLYDFDRRTVVAQYAGDPGADYYSLNGGTGLPMFCTPEDQVRYVEALLARVTGPRTPTAPSDPRRQP